MSKLFFLSLLCCSFAAAQNTNSQCNGQAAFSVTAATFASAIPTPVSGTIHICKVTFGLSAGVNVSLVPTTSGAALTLSGTIANTSPTVTAVSSTLGLLPGMLVTGTGIPSNTVITAVPSATSLTLSQNATSSSGAQTLSFFLTGPYSGIGTFSVHFSGDVKPGVGYGVGIVFSSAITGGGVITYSP